MTFHRDLLHSIKKVTFIIFDFWIIAAKLLKTLTLRFAVAVWWVLIQISVEH